MHMLQLLAVVDVHFVGHSLAGYGVAIGQGMYE